MQNVRGAWDRDRVPTTSMQLGYMRVEKTTLFDRNAIYMLTTTKYAGSFKERGRHSKGHVNLNCSAPTKKDDHHEYLDENFHQIASQIRRP